MKEERPLKGVALVHEDCTGGERAQKEEAEIHDREAVRAAESWGRGQGRSALRLKKVQYGCP